VVYAGRYQKVWLSFDDQVIQLEERGLLGADNYQREIARIGYYRLSAYWYPFRDLSDYPTQPEAFKPGSTFENVLELDKLRQI
jgi:abortive infection bacteriophage resistance protein